MISVTMLTDIVNVNLDIQETHAIQVVQLSIYCRMFTWYIWKRLCFQCSTNCDLLTCDKTNGSCECKLGYEPPLCEQKKLQQQGKFDYIIS